MLCATYMSSIYRGIDHGCSFHTQQYALIDQPTIDIYQLSKNDCLLILNFWSGEKIQIFNYYEQWTMGGVQKWWNKERVVCPRPDVAL